MICILVTCCLRSYILGIYSAGNSASQTCPRGRFKGNARLRAFEELAALHITCPSHDVNLPTPLKYPQAMSKYTEVIGEVYFDMDEGYLC